MDVTALLETFVAAGPLHVLTDYDGTLAPIVADPEGATPLPGILDVLRALPAAGIRLSVVSGRPVDYLLAHLAPLDAELVGQYGLESHCDGVRTVEPRVEEFRGAIAGASEELERALAAHRIERKGGIAVTVHWRERGTIADSELAAIEAIARRHGLVIHATRMARELRPPIDVDKGAAVERIVRASGARTAMFLGDDLGDLVAFHALDRLAQTGVLVRKLNVGVVSEEMPPQLNECADVLVDGPPGVLALLRALAQLVTR